MAFILWNLPTSLGYQKFQIRKSGVFYFPNQIISIFNFLLRIVIPIFVWAAGSADGKKGHPFLFLSVFFFSKQILTCLKAKNPIFCDTTVKNHLITTIQGNETIDEKFGAVGETLSHFPHTFLQLWSKYFLQISNLKKCELETTRFHHQNHFKCLEQIYFVYVLKCLSLSINRSWIYSCYLSRIKKTLVHR